MLKNYITMAWRSLRRNKLHTVINILGLSVGISACLVILLIVFYEFSFNRSIPDRDNIYRVYTSFSGLFSGKNHGVTAALPGYLQQNLVGRAEVVALHNFSTDVAVPQANGEPKVMKEQRSVVITQPEYFSMFALYTWVAGNPQSALRKPFQVVLTESKARAYFGNIPPQTMVGRDLVYSDSLQVTVSGIVKQSAAHTDIDFTDFISLSTIEASWLKDSKNLTDWESTNSASQCFIKAINKEAVQQQLAQAGNQYKEHNKEFDAQASYYLQPLDELHFGGDIGIFDSTERSPAHKPTLVVITIVAMLLVIIAVVNFINLETAQAIKRAKEVGIRKVMGSLRSRLIIQFLLQSFMITLCAVALSIPLAETAVNVFHEFIPPGMIFTLDTMTIGILLVITVTVGLLSGFYPAFVLSSFLPARALKSNSYMSGGSIRSAFLRKTLIVFQFTIAQILIVGTLIVVAQIRFMLNKDLGFTKETIININTPWRLRAMVSKFQDKLAQTAVVQDLTVCVSTPSAAGYNSSIFTVNTGKDVVKENVYRKFGDTNFIPFFGLKLLAGRNIAASDTIREFVINETYMKILGIHDPQKALGLEMEVDNIKYPIVGVVKDFHSQSLHHGMQPIGISSEKKAMGKVSIKLTQQADIQTALAQIEKSWQEVFPNQKFDYQFMDETIARFYETEQRTSKLMSTATTIAIILSCLGLFGLASYEATQRTREIGIRKVLGATVRAIVIMLSRDFIRLIVLAFVLAAPIAYFMADHWLRDFAFRIGISAWLFVAAAIGAVFIALVTVSYHAIRAALANPADSLRSE